MSAETADLPFDMGESAAHLAGPGHKYRAQLKLMASEWIPPHLQSRLHDSEVIQEVLLRANRDPTSLCGISEAGVEAKLRAILASYLSELIRHDAEHGRAKSPEPRTIEMHPRAAEPTSAGREMLASERAEHVRVAVSQLSADHRRVILLRHQLQLSFAEIGDRMQRSPHEARVMWGQAMVALGQLLEPADGRL